MLATFSILASLVGKRALVVWQWSGWHHKGWPEWLPNGENIQMGCFVSPRRGAFQVWAKVVPGLLFSPIFLPPHFPLST